MLFAKGSMPNVPRLETRKALLVIDLQNDFLHEDGKLFVKNVKDFLPKIPSLVAKFREGGDIFWVHTEFQGTRPTICPASQTYAVVLEDFLETTKSREANPSHEAELAEHDFKRPVKYYGKDDPEAFLAERSKADWPRCCLPNTFGCAAPQTVALAIDQKRDSTITKTCYSAFQTKSLLPSLRMRFITQLYLCGSLSNISVYATALDAVSHGLEVTVIEDCVGYRNPKCHEEAMRQMADTMGVNGTDYQELMDDLHGNLGDVVTPSTFNSAIGTRQVDGNDSSENYTMRVKVKRWMDDVNDGKANHGPCPDSEGVDTFKAGSAKRRSLGNGAGLNVSRAKKQEMRPSPVPAPQKRSSDKIDSEEEPVESISRPSQSAKTSRIRMRRMHMTPEGKESASPATADKVGVDDPRRNQTTPPSSVAIIEADSDPDHSLLDEMSSLVDKAKAFGRTLRGAERSKQPSPKVLGPGDFIGERDSRVIYDFLPAVEHFKDAFTGLRKDGEPCEVRWQEMYHRSGKVPRLVAVQGEAREDGSIPIYRHPADESPPFLPFSPVVQNIREEVEKTIGHPVNHVLIQLYRGGEDNISEHSDKTLDIVHGSFIVNVSLGAKRTMTLRTKKSAPTTQALNQSRRASAPASSPYLHADVKRTAQRIPLPHNSLFILGQDTNRMWLHAIRADKRPASEKTAEELAFNEERISLTFRHIGTFINPKHGTIWGQGATSKSFEGARSILQGEEAEEEGERLIRAFGQENHQSYDFDWQEQYGAGFDVVNFTTKQDTVTTA